MDSNTFGKGHDYRRRGERLRPTPELPLSPLSLDASNYYAPDVFVETAYHGSMHARDLTQHALGLGGYGKDKFLDITNDVVDDTFRTTFANDDPAKLKNDFLTDPTLQVAGIDDIIAQTTPQQRKDALLKLGVLKDDRIFLERSPYKIAGIGPGQDFIHRINDAQTPDYDSVGAFGRIRDRITSSQEFLQDFSLYIDTNFDREELSEQRLEELKKSYFNIYEKRDEDAEYLAYLNGDLEEQFKHDAALELLKEQDLNRKLSQERMIQRAIELTTDGDWMKVFKTIAGSIANPIDLGILAGDLVIGTKGAVWGSKFGPIMKSMEKAGLVNNRMLPGTNYARTKHDIYHVAWTLAKREIAYIGFTEGIVGATEIFYHLDNGDDLSTAFTKSAPRLLLAPAAGAALRGAGSIVFDKLSLKGGVNGLIGMDEIKVMTRELEDIMGLEPNTAGRIEIANLLNNHTEIRKRNGVNILVVKGLGPDDDITEAVRAISVKTIKQQKDDIVKFGADGVTDFVDGVYRPVVFTKEGYTENENDVVVYRATDFEFDIERPTDGFGASIYGSGIYTTDDFSTVQHHILGKSKNYRGDLPGQKIKRDDFNNQAGSEEDRDLGFAYEMVVGKPDGSKLNYIDGHKRLDHDDLEEYKKILLSSDEFTEHQKMVLQSRIESMKYYHKNIRYGDFVTMLYDSGNVDFGMRFNTFMEKSEFTTMLRKAFYSNGYDGVKDGPNSAFFSNEVIKQVRRIDGLEKRLKKGVVQEGAWNTTAFYDVVPTHHKIIDGLIKRFKVNDHGHLEIDRKLLTKVEETLLKQLGIKFNKKDKSIYLKYGEFKKLDIFTETEVNGKKVLNVNHSLKLKHLDVIRQSIKNWIEDTNDLLANDYKITDIEGYMVKMFDDNLLHAGDYVYIKNTMPPTFMMHLVNPEMSIFRRKIKEKGLKDNFTNIAFAFGNYPEDITQQFGRKIDEDGGVLKPTRVVGGGEIDSKGLDLYQMQKGKGKTKKPEPGSFHDILERIYRTVAMRNNRPYYNVIKLFSQTEDFANVGFDFLDMMKDFQKDPNHGIQFSGVVNKLIEANITLDDIVQIHKTFKVTPDGKKIQDLRTAQLFDVDSGELEDLYKKMLDEKIRIKRKIMKDAVVKEMTPEEYLEYYPTPKQPTPEGDLPSPIKSSPTPQQPEAEGKLRWDDDGDDELPQQPKPIGLVSGPMVITKLEITGDDGVKRIGVVIDKKDAAEAGMTGTRELTESEVNDTAAAKLKELLEGLEEGKTKGDQMLYEVFENGKLWEWTNDMDIHNEMSDIVSELNMRTLISAEWKDWDESMDAITEMYRTFNKGISTLIIEKYWKNWNAAYKKIDPKLLELADEIGNLETRLAAGEKIKKQVKEAQARWEKYVKDNNLTSKLSNANWNLRSKLTDDIKEALSNRDVFYADDFNNYAQFNIGGKVYNINSNTAKQSSKAAKTKTMNIKYVKSGKEIPDKKSKGTIYIINSFDEEHFKAHEYAEGTILMYRNGKLIYIKYSHDNYVSDGLPPSYELNQFYMNNLSKEHDGLARFETLDDMVASIIQKEIKQSIDKGSIETKEHPNEMNFRHWDKVTKFRDAVVARNAEGDAVFYHGGDKYIVGENNIGDAGRTLVKVNANGESRIMGTHIGSEKTAFRIISNVTEDEDGVAKAASCMRGVIGE